MCAFIAPVADDAVTKLQNLMQNTLYSIADITFTLAPEKAREFQEECARQGVELPAEGAAPPAAAEAASESTPAEETYDNAAPGSIMDRVNRLGLLNDHFQATIDELPDLRTTREQVVNDVKLLHEECERAGEELKSLYAEFDSAFRLLRTQIDNDMQPQQQQD
ncbi:large ribosomal subunit processing protein, putative [Babesia ovata]|uniref:Large ribosomal subunit processing protein, putative n=1 Tax=Babesia ovata TaxID=189622 RepID=A0A2H6K9J6_9APIC|nr:large ribosomal subunit processing protein, putative [Babesia ovata]GBE59666.1 large ribosomal subunit processing protein, putative [Babesia ovata]